MQGEPRTRKVRPDELELVWRVHVASSHDLAARRGGRPTNQRRAMPGWRW
ncbi:MAG TPA: hypothetical protein VNC82_03635 [Candidatus Limnocylindria bacterium]|nr:hypothetical protein [Candidatus Limnocylindria bacterium]